MISQTRYAVEALKKAGYERSEFRVRTECKNGEYGDALVSIRADKSRQIELAEKVAENGIEVLFMVWKEERISFPIYDTNPRGIARVRAINYDLPLGIRYDPANDVWEEIKKGKFNG